MQILITGVAGFIGFNFAKFLLDKKISIYGVDNINDYYSVSLKKNRLKELKKFKNFKFKKLDIRNRKLIDKFLKKEKINQIIHLAAQAGVRYSLLKPSEFVDNNILGSYNLIYSAKKNKIKNIFYASSSSVYGDSKKFPLNELQIISPKNVYALSKKVNEELAKIYSKQFKMKIIGLRFFTVYGEWGRPDMFMMKYLNSSYNKNVKFYLNNFGNHIRDFTYINDVCKILFKLIFIKKKYPNNEVFNICSNSPISLFDVIKNINILTTKKPKIFKRKLQEADVVKTHGSNKKILSIIGKIKFTSIKEGLSKTVNWYRDYY